MTDQFSISIDYEMGKHYEAIQEYSKAEKECECMCTPSSSSSSSQDKSY